MLAKFYITLLQHKFVILLPWLVFDPDAAKQHLLDINMFWKQITIKKNKQTKKTDHAMDWLHCTQFA